MRVTIEQRPVSACAVCCFEAEERLLAPRSAVLSASPNLLAQVGTESETERITAREFRSLSAFSSPGGPGTLVLAPPLPGDLVLVGLCGSLLLRASALLGVEPAVRLSFAPSSLFRQKELWFKLEGEGKVLFSGFGAVESLDLEDERLVDPGRCVACTTGSRISFARFGGWRSVLLGAEKPFCRLAGAGKLWMETRSTGEFLRVLTRLDD